MVGTAESVLFKEVFIESVLYREVPLYYGLGLPLAFANTLYSHSSHVVYVSYAHRFVTQ